ncbi:MAG: hypothetical protein AABZ06_05390 [Bdellovibrionota bacterium]
MLQKRNANEWATWKEQTPFKKDAGFELEAKIEDNINDNRKSAIQYILLHELGHVISVNEYFHPPWGVYPDSLKNIEQYAFFNESWKIDGAQKGTERSKKLLGCVGERSDVQKRKLSYPSCSVAIEAVPKTFSVDFPSLPCSSPFRRQLLKRKVAQCCTA